MKRIKAPDPITAWVIKRPGCVEYWPTLVFGSRKEAEAHRNRFCDPSDPIVELREVPGQKGGKA